MLGIDRGVLKAVWTVFLFALVLFIVYKIARTLIVFTLAIFLALLLSPIVDTIGRVLPRRGARAFALAFVYLAMTGIVVAIAIAP